MVYFYARAIQALKHGGALTFITSNKYMRAGYGKKLRELLRVSLTISQVIDFGDLPVFTATSYPAVLVGRKGAAKDGHELRVADLTMPVRRALVDRGLPVTPETVNRAMDGLPDYLNSHGVAGFPQVLLRQSGWALESPNLIRLFERLMNQGAPLDEFVRGQIYYGIKTGLNQTFLIDQQKRDELIAADTKSAEIIKPWLRGRDINRWRAEWGGMYAIHVPWTLDITLYPAVKQHLAKFKDGLAVRPEVQREIYPWFSMSRWAAEYYDEFERPKIVWPDIAREVRFAYDPDGRYLGDTAYAMPTKSMWPLTFMNSVLAEFLLCLITSSLRGGFLRPKRQYMARLPIIVPDKAVQRHLESIAWAGFAGESVDADDLNGMVYDLYAVSRSDIALINDWFERRSLSS